MITCDKCGKQGKSEDVGTYSLALVPDDDFDHGHDFIKAEVQLCSSCEEDFGDMLFELVNTMKIVPPPAPKKRGKKKP